MLAVGREDVVLRAQRAAGADLGGLLAEQLGPDAELAVALERGGLGVDPPGEHHVAVEAAQLLGGEVVVELGVVDALTLGGQQLHELGAAVLLARVRRPPRGPGRMPAGSLMTLLRASGCLGVTGHTDGFGMRSWACVTPTTWCPPTVSSSTTARRESAPSPDRRRAWISRCSDLRPSCSRCSSAADPPRRASRRSPRVGRAGPPATGPGRRLRRPGGDGALAIGVRRVLHGQPGPAVVRRTGRPAPGGRPARALVRLPSWSHADGDIWASDVARVGRLVAALLRRPGARHRRVRPLHRRRPLPLGARRLRAGRRHDRWSARRTPKAPAADDDVPVARPVLPARRRDRPVAVSSRTAGRTCSTRPTASRPRSGCVPLSRSGHPRPGRRCRAVPPRRRAGEPGARRAARRAR